MLGWMLMPANERRLMPKKPVSPERQKHMNTHQELMRCIYAEHCRFCGAMPGHYCIRKVKALEGLPNNSTASYAHMARVRAGHKKWKAREVPPAPKPLSIRELVVLSE